MFPYIPLCSLCSLMFLMFPYVLLRSLEFPMFPIIPYVPLISWHSLMFLMFPYVLWVPYVPLWSSCVSHFVSLGAAVASGDLNYCFCLSCPKFLPKDPIFAWEVPIKPNKTQFSGKVLKGSMPSSSWKPSVLIELSQLFGKRPNFRLRGPNKT